MKKKIVALCLVLALALTAIGGATLAYFTDTDKAENTFVMAKGISAEINEFQREKDEDGNLKNEWSDYENGTSLFPVAYDNANRNNKIVTFRNTSTDEAAYMRTIVLFEKNTKLDENYANEGCEANCNCCPAGLHFSKNEVDAEDRDPKGNYKIHGCTNYIFQDTVTIDEVQYTAVIFEDTGREAIPAGDAQYSILGVWMDKNINNEQMKGWGNDGEVSVLVLGQAIQKNGLTYEQAMKELGELTAENIAKWYRDATNEVETGE